MLRGFDISNHQGRAGFKISNHLDQIDFCICKATEGLTYVDPYCDVFVQTLRAAGKPWGFYHFARNNDAIAEADFFIENTINYFGEGIPVLDWEADQSVEWVNSFVNRLHEKTGVWCWIYANPWRFNQGGVEANCMRWVASYPNVLHPSFDDAESWSAPETDGLVGAWQFCSDGRLSGWDGNLDFNLFYGNEAAWRAYALGDNPESNTGNGSGGLPDTAISELENDVYKITIERK